MNNQHFFPGFCFYIRQTGTTLFRNIHGAGLQKQQKTTAYVAVRGTIFSWQHGALIQSPHETPVHYSTIELRGQRRAHSYSPLCRETPASRTANVRFPSLLTTGVLMSRLCPAGEKQISVSCYIYIYIYYIDPEIYISISCMIK